MPAKLYSVTGEVRDIEPAEPPYLSLDELYHHIETDMVEVVYLPDGRLMIIDEEGKFKANPQRNDLATMIAIHIRTDDVIVGHAIVCTPDMLQRD